ncbi:MAG: DUF3429 domain-containing protein [Kiloniellaceae bacterium]
MAEPKPQIRLAQVPRPALILGCIGLLPFLFGTLGAWASDYPDFILFINLQMAYAAIVLSFLSAVHWGLAMAQGEAADWRRLGLPMLPALSGWLALMVPNGLGLLLLALGFVGIFFIDLRSIAAGQAPSWYKTLRKPLTAIVLTCLAATYGALAANLTYA